MPTPSSCFLSNLNATTDAYHHIPRKSVPRWSVSILLDCQNEANNTAKVNTQVSVKVKKPNLITLLSATVGYQNYGPMFDINQSGVIGQVMIVGKKGNETMPKDLSAHQWSYKVRLHGFEKQLFGTDSELASTWQFDQLPIKKMMTRYETTFKAPPGDDPVVVDLLGLGKGEAWVNGYRISCYSPSYNADEGGCSTEPCYYRGSYDDNKCVVNCRQQTQNWYHVPRSFMSQDMNTLLVFEEYGGNPSLVNFQTATVWSICANAYKQHTKDLACQDRPMSATKFASFGNPQGLCGSFQKVYCDADALTIIQNISRYCFLEQVLQISSYDIFVIFGHYLGKKAARSTCLRRPSDQQPAATSPRG